MIPVDLEETQPIARTAFDGEATQTIGPIPSGIWTRSTKRIWWQHPELSEETT